MHHIQIRPAWKCMKSFSLPTTFVIAGMAFFVFYSLDLKANSNNTVQSHNKEFPIQKKWGRISALPRGLKLDVSPSDAPSTIVIPRMNNRVKTIYSGHDIEKKPLKLKPGVNEWEILLPHETKLTKPLSIIVEFKETPFLPVKPNVIRENKKHQLVLDAKDAVVHGKMLRYEPQPHKNTVGYWINEEDWCEWKFIPKSSGVFDVYILQGCGTGQGGSKVKLSVNQRALDFVVEETGHFQNFKERHIGSIKIDNSSIQSLQLKPQRKANKAIMDVRQIRLVRQKSHSS